MNELIFNFEGHGVEVINFNGQTLFNPYDVGRCLDLSGSTVRMHI
jgi:prophage antirepressor-like protein